ncbi:nitric oxide synthase-interacting protein [Latimeria chalumnae]|uniref:Nitric oxide synthase-interacting protein n=1 Tax=Latimeria chalumnae TaxID=7897 RepID=H3BAX5_LATCH|nr:PREDICTED: nitric oxide synthase-interacting protein [Latimeria chalumnae]XP_005991007.1 PREDICTED: nitric oxide synthase-interacting protein [Latimeria chalumnae]XP_005991008.1 PREDICTED: nitric oxide synthase-interacting protein [Latimeria chalumnae]XP_005991009.1 PREDICTED: nitric oxide synthase-interacting protein [Latimeria chalumnae]|eukprot:XP_005991006.1 PREDICTED: nitric oxide synthase-interacting protein [Latimeria chalumnae]
MTRHGKNCTAGAVYTYYEKRKDTAASGYGTQSARLSKDSIKDFDCCSLSLQPCKDPVVTPEGYLYEKEAILEYILHQKREIAKKMKAFEKQKNEKKAEAQELVKAAKDTKVKAFLAKETTIVSKPLNPFTVKADAAQPSTSEEGADPQGKQLPSFWIPSLTPEAKASKIRKPDKCVYCPMSGMPLKMKDLIPVKFTPIDPKLDRVGLITRQDRYMCAVTHDVLGNSVPCAVLRPSGVAVTMECVEKLIKKDMVDPVTGDKLKEKDIIVLQRGGTGFSGSGALLQATESRPVMQA